MPHVIRALKSKSHKGKGKSSKPTVMVSASSNRLAKLLNIISNNRRSMSKAEINLPARLMQNMNMHHENQQVDYSKTVSSTFTSSMHDGEMHSAGKEIIDDSTRPYIQIAELHNGQVERYMIPRHQVKHTSYRNHSKQTKSKRSKKTKQTKQTKKIMTF